MSRDFDACVIGSGAGAGPIIWSLAKAGYSVVVLEKGPYLQTKDFFKDERNCCLRGNYKPDLRDEPQIVVEKGDDGHWHARNTYRSGIDFWNGNIVGGSSNFMSGFFHRLKPVDFHLLSTFGPVEGANVADWPIRYEDLEPYYTKVERIIGVSGRIIKHPYQEPRSTPDFPYPPTREHPVSELIDKAGQALGYHPMPTPRAILPYNALGRDACSYSGYCGAYGCATGAKGSSRAALIDQAVATGRVQVRPYSMVKRIKTNGSGNITAVEYLTKEGQTKQVDARIYVVACQAVETSRLLLNSTGPKHENGLANRNGQVGKNLLFAGGGGGSGRLVYSKMSKEKAKRLKIFGPFINRALQDWYVIDDPDFGPPQKGGTIDFVHMHPNPVVRATRQIYGENGLIWGKPLKRKLERDFIDSRYIKIEAFCDWMPIDDCNITLDTKTRDKWNLPVSKVRIGYHMQNVQVGWYLASRGAKVLKKMGAENVVSFASSNPPTNLMAGGCRFGHDPETSVLDTDCRSHEIENLFVSDGSFMPTGGSVPYTWTIYANSFRVADKILAQLGGEKQRSSRHQNS